VPERNPPAFVTTDLAYDGSDLGLPYRDLIGEGVRGYGDLRVSQRGAGANMSVDISAGSAWIMGDDNVDLQPNYRVVSDSVVNKAIATADATNPRVDRVIAEVLDSEFSGASKLWQLRVITGTPTVGATLDNLTGAAAVPNNAILLADVLVAASDTSITDAEIRDRRPFGMRGVVPPLLTDRDEVLLEPSAQVINFTTTAVISHTAPHDLRQAAALFYLTRRIAGATRIRWKYRQGSTALTGNYVIAIYDASGRLIIDTGSVAFTGALNTYQERAETITATTFEPGAYYVFIGVDTTAGNLSCPGFNLSQEGFAQGPSRNVVLGATSGGVTVPTTLLGLTDQVGVTADSIIPGLPQIALSVG